MVVHVLTQSRRDMYLVCWLVHLCYAGGAVLLRRLQVIAAHGPGQKQPSIHDGRPCLQVRPVPDST